MFGPENAPFWFGFALGFSAAAFLCAAMLWLSGPKEPYRDPYGDPWQ